MDNDDEFCLKWNNHHSTFLTVLHSLLKKEVLVDVTLAAEGKFIEAHRLVLSTCSEYFQDALRTHENRHAFIFLNNVMFEDLQALVDYMYIGEVNVSQEQLPRFLATAEALKIKGLSDKVDSSEKPAGQTISPIQANLKNSPKQLTKTIKPSLSNINVNSSQSSNRQTRQSCQQMIVPHHSIPPLSQSCSSSTQHSLNSSDTHREVAQTPDVNFIAVNDNHQTNEMDESEDNGLETLGNVWSMNQVGHQEANEGNWENDLLAGDGTSTANQDETDCHDVSSESENPIEYHQYTEALQHANSEDTKPATTSTNKRSIDLWMPSISAPSISTKGKSSGNNTSAGPDFLESQHYRCPNCGREYSQKGSLNRHLKFECGIVPKFPCQLCPMRFRRAYKLTEHFNRIHANQSTTLNPS